MTDLAASSWNSEGNLLVPLHRIRLALGLSFLAASVFWVFTYLGDKKWHDLNPGNSGSFVTPPWIWGLRVTLVLVPFVLSLLLLSTRSEHSKAAGARVAFALFSTAFLFGLAGLVVVFLGISPAIYAPPAVAAILAFVASSLWIVVSAIRIGKVSLGPFFLALVITAVFLAWGNHFLDDKDYELGREYEMRKGRAAIERFAPVGGQTGRLGQSAKRRSPLPTTKGDSLAGHSIVAEDHSHTGKGPAAIRASLVTPVEST